MQYGLIIQIDTLCKIVFRVANDDDKVLLGFDFSANPLQLVLQQRLQLLSQSFYGILLLIPSTSHALGKLQG